MVKQVTVPPINCYSPSFLPGTYVVEDENLLLQDVPWLPHTHTVSCDYPFQLNKCKNILKTHEYEKNIWVCFSFKIPLRSLLSRMFGDDMQPGVIVTFHQQWHLPSSVLEAHLLERKSKWFLFISNVSGCFPLTTFYYCINIFLCCYECILPLASNSVMP